MEMLFEAIVILMVLFLAANCPLAPQAAPSSATLQDANVRPTQYVNNWRLLSIIAAHASWALQYWHRVKVCFQISGFPHRIDWLTLAFTMDDRVTSMNPTWLCMNV